MRSNYEMTQKHVSHEVFNAFIDRMVQKTNKKYVDDGSDYRTSVIDDIDVYYDGTYLYGDVTISAVSDSNAYKEACKIFYEEFSK